MLCDSRTVMLELRVLLFLGRIVSAIHAQRNCRPGNCTWSFLAFVAIACTFGPGEAFETSALQCCQALSMTVSATVQHIVSVLPGGLYCLQAAVT